MTGILSPILHPLLRQFRGSPTEGLRVSSRFLLWVVIVLGIVLRLCWGAVMEASNDEAYHYLYTTHPALSYFDHPPMTAWVAKAGILLCGGWVHPVSLRLGFTLMFAGATWVLARWTVRWFGEWAGVYAAILLNLSGYYATIGGFALPDVPCVFFSLLAMWAISEACVGQPARIWPWVWVGLAFGGAMLSKYYAVFLPASAALYILLTPGTRRLLLTPGPYLAVALGFAMFSPVLLWNSSHGWASFRFQGGRAVSTEFNPKGLIAFAFGPVVYLLPWVWYLLAKNLAQRVRHFGSVAGVERLIVCLAIVPLAFFAAVSCKRWILLHWPIIGFLPLFPLAGAAWAAWASADPIWSRRRIAMMGAVIFVGALVGIAQARFGVIRFSGKDPMEDVSGWESVAAELRARDLLGKPNTFLFTTCWFASGELAFTTREQSPVLCYNSGDARGFAFWSKPEQWVGWDGYLVTTETEPWEVMMLKPYFVSFRKVAEFPMSRGGTQFRTVTVWKCIHQLMPFAFNYPEK
jgi:Dolichyl-phosphate-mannose-protein mannosyltransferase